jgi:nucleoside-diphosphate-sugar epimerase
MTPSAHQPFTPLRLLIAGCGYVGSALGATLAREGHAVWGLKRRPLGLPEGIRPIAADLGSAAQLPLPPELDQVVYAVSPDDSSVEAYAAYVAGLDRLLSALRQERQRPRRILLTSSTGVYGQNQGEWVDEDSPTEPASSAGEQLLMAERLLLGSDFPATVLRLGGIYGPGRARLLERVRSGSADCRPGIWSNRIHRDDCVGALRHLMLLPDAAPIYIGVDREPAELCTILHWLAGRLGTPPPRAQPAEEGHSRGRATNKRCSSQRLVRSGYHFVFPTYREGFGALLAPE